MLKKSIFWVFISALLGFASCTDDDSVGHVDKVDLLRFEFPQGNESWDKEIEQIAKDWGMYIIYKDVDSTHLNRMWTSPIYNDPIYVCTTPSDEDIQVYLGLVKEWLLGSLDKNSQADKDQLPLYLYLVNDLNDGNPRSVTYQKRHIQFKKDGLDYWSLSFTKEELEAELTPEMIHNVACSFSYPGLKVRFTNGEYVVPADFASMTDYETRIGIRYYSFEQFKEVYPFFSEDMYLNMIGTHERDPKNAFKRRGFAPQIGEDFKPVTVVNGYSITYGAPTWMPWIYRVFEYPDVPPMEIDVNPGPVAKTVEERVLLDFMNMVRLAMTYPEAKIREDFPVDTGDPLDQAGNKIINAKYDLVVKYMKETYNVDLPRYASILDE